MAAGHAASPSLGMLDPRDRPAAGRRRQREPMVVAVALLQPRARVGEPDPRRGGPSVTPTPSSRTSSASRSPSTAAAMTSLPGAARGAEPVAERVFDQRLQDQLRHRGGQRVRRDVPRHLQPVAETHLLDLQVRLEQRDLVAQRATPAPRRRRACGARSALSWTIIRSAAAASRWTSSAIDCSVLNRKCG